MWSYEKIHRCIAHLFLGELVATFDEEFRILYAQSEPLIIDQSEGNQLAMSDTSSTSSYYCSQFGLKRSQSWRNQNPFRRNDPFRHTIEPGPGITIGKYSQQ